MTLTWIIFAMVASAELVTAELSLDSKIAGCSRPLAEFISMLCKGGLPISDFDVSQLSRTRRAAMTLVGHRRRRQIIDECCKNPCTVSELMDYCPVPSTPYS